MSQNTPPKLPFPKAALFPLVLLLALGLALILWPGVLTAFMPVLIGTVLILAGVSAVLSAVTKKEWFVAPSIRILFGVVAVVVGLVFLINQDVSIMFLSVLFGLYVLIMAALGFVETYRGLRAGHHWVGLLLENLVQVVLGLLLLLKPFSGLNIWVQVLGIHFVVMALGSFFTLWQLWRTACNPPPPDDDAENPKPE